MFRRISLRELWKRFEVPIENNRWDRPLFKVAMRTVASSLSDPSVVIDVQSTSGQSFSTADKTNELPQATVFKSSWKPKSKKATEASTIPTNSAVVSPPSASTAAATLTISGSTLEALDNVASFQQPDEVFESMLNHLTTSTTYVPNCSTVTPLHAQADMLYELDRTSQKILSMIIAHQTEAVEGTPIQLVEYDRAFNLYRHVGLSELQHFRRQFVKINAQHPPASSQEIGASFVDFLASHL